MGEFTLKKLRKLRCTYFLILRTIGYVKWKKKALELFSSVHDLDILARIMRQKKNVINILEKNGKSIKEISKLLELKVEDVLMVLVEKDLL